MICSSNGDFVRLLGKSEEVARRIVAQLSLLRLGLLWETLETDAFADMSSHGHSIEPGETDDESNVLVTLLALGQHAIEAGDYCDISDFLAEMAEENHR